MEDWFSEIVRRRRAGMVRCFCTSRYGETPAELAVRFGLDPGEHELLEVTRAEALSILEALLSKDMAYMSELMEEGTAKALARQTIDRLSGDGARYYSNGHWDLYGRDDAFQWRSVTSSTFDGGVIVVSSDMAGGVWFEDED